MAACIHEKPDAFQQQFIPSSYTLVLGRIVFSFPEYRAYSPRADLTQFGPGFGIREQLPERSSVPTELRAGVAS